jgi:N-acetyl-anhydromuramyl-L-alanine amidase AmpD
MGRRPTFATALFLAASMAASTAAADDEATIVDKPITFDAERTKLTLEYRRQHEDPAAKDITIAPRMVVLHYTAGGSFEGTWKYFDRVRVEEDRERTAAAGDVNVSSHFVIDRDGTIYRLVPETTMARHCIGLNHVAIGVENVGDGKKYPLTDAQVDANVRLIRYLASRHAITHVIGHHEYRRMEGHPYFVERDPKYRNEKPDPGAAFMEKVRGKIADLKLDGAPPAKPKAKAKARTRSKARAK